MRLCLVALESIPGSPYSQSAMVDTDHLDRESWDDYDERTWRDHCTTNGKDEVMIPCMALKQCVDTAGFKLGLKIPGRRGATYKTFLASGFFCNADVALQNGAGPWVKKDAVMVPINANADGKRGSGTRVKRRYPVFPKWSAMAEFTITDDIITQDVFETHVKASGIIVGIGRFRPEKGGINGRFRATRFEWQDFQL